MKIKFEPNKGFRRGVITIPSSSAIAALVLAVLAVHSSNERTLGQVIDHDRQLRSSDLVAGSNLGFGLKCLGSKILAKRLPKSVGERVLTVEIVDQNSAIFRVGRFDLSSQSGVYTVATCDGKHVRSGSIPPNLIAFLRNMQFENGSRAENKSVLDGEYVYVTSRDSQKIATMMSYGADLIDPEAASSSSKLASKLSRIVFNLSVEH